LAENNPYRREDLHGDEGESYAPTEEKRKGPGCLFWGCLGVVVLVVGGLIGLVVGAGMLGNYVVTNYTSDAPLEISTTAYGEPEMEELRNRVDSFADALDRGEDPGVLELTAADLNALVFEEFEDHHGKGAIRFDIDDSVVTGQISIPLDDPEVPEELRDRYINGTALFEINLVDGRLFVTIDSLKIGSKELPEWIMTDLRSKNIAEEILVENPDLRESVAKFESIKVDDGKVLIKVRKGETFDRREDSEEAA